MFQFLKKTMDYKWVKLSKFGHFEKFELNIPSDRVFSGLSENHNYSQFGPTKLTLWPLERNSHYNLLCVCVILKCIFVQDFSFDSLLFEATFPGEYPLQPLSTRVSAHKSIPSEVVQHINQCLEGYLTAEGFQCGTLMFRPFLHWLDRNFVTVLKDALSVFKPLVEEGDFVDGQESLSKESLSEGDSEEVSEEEVEKSAMDTLPVKAGTEIRLVRLSLSSSVATVTFTSPTIIVACGRCKKQEDVKAKPETYV